MRVTNLFNNYFITLLSTRCYHGVVFSFQMNCIISRINNNYNNNQLYYYSSRSSSSSSRRIGGGGGGYYLAKTKTTTTKTGDKLREGNNIRPSLHPTTINAIAEALKIRAANVNNDIPLRLDKENDINPLQIAMSAGRIASEAIIKRQKASNDDDMKLSKKEEQTIAGRIVGVIMRLDDLEVLLQQKCSNVSWISKYNDWKSFGLLGNKNDNNNNSNKNINNNNNNNNNNETKITNTNINDDIINHEILNDPLFVISRAECLLALFIHTIEKPNLEKINESVPDDSQIDFLDEDRKQVLLLE